MLLLNICFSFFNFYLGFHFYYYLGGETDSWKGLVLILKGKEYPVMCTFWVFPSSSVYTVIIWYQHLLEVFSCLLIFSVSLAHTYESQQWSKTIIVQGGYLFSLLHIEEDCNGILLFLFVNWRKGIYAFEFASEAFFLPLPSPKVCMICSWKLNLECVWLLLRLNMSLVTSFACLYG